jgi:hypothetical protein
VQLDERELGRAVDGHEEVKLTLLGTNLGDVDVEEAERIGLELPLGGLLALNAGQPGYAMPLQAAVQRGAGETWDRRLQGVETVVQRQQGMTAESDDDRLCRRGAPMEYLAHSASLHSGMKSAPSKPGIKHLISGMYKDCGLLTYGSSGLASALSPHVRAVLWTVIGSARPELR